MPSTPATISLAQIVPHVGVCALCTTGPDTLHNAVIVRHVAAATLEFVACDRCTAAVRRLIAAAGAVSSAGPAQMLLASHEEQLPVLSDMSASDIVGEPVVIHEFLGPFLADDGVAYTVRVRGQGRSDGTWIGWLTFAAADGRATRTTGRETTQSSREHLAYWATGIQPSYLEGAFRRAT